MSDPAIAERHPAGAVGHQHRVFRPGHFDIVERDVLHELRRVGALLIACSDQVMKGHAGNRDNRRAVHVRVIQAVEEVDDARPRGADAEAKLAGVLGKARRHEGRRFLVTHPDVPPMRSGFRP
jgi:hypothetical protein